MSEVVTRILEEARDQIADEERWLQKISVAFDGSGKACAWCSLGSLEAVRGVSSEDFEEAVAILGDTCYELGCPRVTTYNDTHTHTEVMAMWDKAIAKSKSKSKTKDGDGNVVE